MKSHLLRKSIYIGLSTLMVVSLSGLPKSNKVSAKRRIKTVKISHFSKWRAKRVNTVKRRVKLNSIKLQRAIGFLKLHRKSKHNIRRVNYYRNLVKSNNRHLYHLTYRRIALKQIKKSNKRKIMSKNKRTKRHISKKRRNKYAGRKAVRRRKRDKKTSKKVNKEHKKIAKKSIEKPAKNTNVQSSSAGMNSNPNQQNNNQNITSQGSTNTQANSFDNMDVPSTDDQNGNPRHDYYDNAIRHFHQRIAALQQEERMGQISSGDEMNAEIEAYRNSNNEMMNHTVPSNNDNIKPDSNGTYDHTYGHINDPSTDYQISDQQFINDYHTHGGNYIIAHHPVVPITDSDSSQSYMPVENQQELLNVLQRLHIAQN